MDMKGSDEPRYTVRFLVSGYPRVFHTGGHNQASCWMEYEEKQSQLQLSRPLSVALSVPSHPKRSDLRRSGWHGKCRADHYSNSDGVDMCTVIDGRMSW